ncbi:ABC transporter substrate-binding protein [Hoeflea prorocentri]|uniref:ABC transporter substrate-binding protein n=1 Tax=Hoeflea prorocentri TaxID=1922333 RepID=A0A9X3UN02_9HYPH|nr:ABC transporter substrate-binding protein [Hoeflea prorocentri]MCY6383375.1 ABC transporter substrate-binding protein [Hoeflea prorocentri]MDA5401175.1 ABC transporter substrate-binding protein [Hoeflea prorocentri]
MLSRSVPTVALFLAVLLFPALAMAQGLKKVAIGVDWFINPNHGPLVVALERGYFKEAGLDVSIVTPEKTTDNVTMVLDGRVAIGMSDQPRTQIEIANGSTLSVVGTLIPVPLNAVLTIEGGPIKTVEDIRGKRVGFADSEKTERDLLMIALAAQGINGQDITLVDVEFDMVSALLDGKVDALTDVYRNFEPIRLQLAGATPKVFDVEAGTMPIYSELVYIANNTLIEPDVVDKFLVAVERGVKAIVDDPDAGWETFIKYDPKLDTELNRLSWEATVPLYSTRPATVDEAAFARFATFLVANQLVARMPALNTYIYGLQP